ncbi:MAG: peptidoglycan-binding domain-containing protein [Terriglobia bacterium]
MWRHTLLRAAVVTAILVCCAFPVCATTHARRKVSTSRSSLHHRRVTVGRRSVARARKYRGWRFHHRSRIARSRRGAATRIAPQRTEQIQQALFQAGDLHEQPTGNWDVQTREAMKHYQQSHGFTATGLPDAKSLMKMGLGPHPLPPDAHPLAQAQPSAAPPVDGARPGGSDNLPDD